MPEVLICPERHAFVQKLHIVWEVLVRVFTCEQNRLILQTKVPEAVLVTGQENEEETLLAEQLQWADAVVFWRESEPDSVHAA